VYRHISDDHLYICPPPHNDSSRSHTGLKGWTWTRRT